MTFDASLEKDVGKPSVEDDEDAIVYVKRIAFVPNMKALGVVFILSPEGLDKKIWNNILLSFNMLNLERILCKPHG